MIVWSRPFDRPPGTVFCAVHDVDASVHTLCNGRWRPDARDEIRWEVDEEERCGACDVMSREPRVRRDAKPANALQPAAAGSPCSRATSTPSLRSPSRTPPPSPTTATRRRMTTR